MDNTPFANARRYFPLAITWFVLLAGISWLAAIDTVYARWEFVLRYAFLATLVTGIWAVLVWTTLYGKTPRQKLMAVPLTLVATTVALPLSGPLFGAVPWLPILGLSLLLWMFGQPALLVARSKSHWRIGPEDMEPLPNKRPFSLKQPFSLKWLFLITTMVAVVIVLTDLLDLGVKGIVACLLPFIWPMVVLSVFSRVGIWLTGPTLLFVTCVFAFVSAWGVDRGHLLSLDIEPTLLAGFATAYASSGLLQILAATYVRRRGWLIQCGGEQGFGAPRTTPGITIPKGYLYALGTLSLLGFVVGTGWLYYPQWVAKSWPLPAQPSNPDLPNLFAVASYPMPADPRRREVRQQTAKLFSTTSVTTERDLKLSARFAAAENAVTSMGDRAVPFLLNEITNDTSSSFWTPRWYGSRSLAIRILRKLARDGDVGMHEEAIIETLSSDPETLSRSYEVIACFGDAAIPTVQKALQSTNPEVVQAGADCLREIAYLAAPQTGRDAVQGAIPDLERACLRNAPGRRPYNRLYRILVELIDEDAIATLASIMKDPAQSRAARYAAAVALTEFPTETVTTEPEMVRLLHIANQNGDTWRMLVALSRMDPAYTEIATAAAAVIEVPKLLEEYDRDAASGEGQ